MLRDKTQETWPVLDFPQALECTFFIIKQSSGDRVVLFHEQHAHSTWAVSRPSLDCLGQCAYHPQSAKDNRLLLVITHLSYHWLVCKQYANSQGWYRLALDYLRFIPVVFGYSQINEITEGVLKVNEHVIYIDVWSFHNFYSCFWSKDI